jgi:hypothetical protein
MLMVSPKYKFQMYKQLHANIANIYAEARKAADDIGIPPDIRGKFGLTGAISSCHALLRRDVAEAMDAVAREVIANKFLAEELREIIKDVYGDEYDAAAVNTCEAALWMTYDVLATPPLLGRGENYRARYIAPYERHMHHQAGYGRPFPPRYKDMYADRGCTAGEFSMQGKRLNALDVVIVPLEGARYDCHGIKYHPAVLLTRVDVEASLKKIAEVASRHAPLVSAFASLAYDTPGYGYGTHDEDGTPSLQKGLAAMAREYGVPYISDNAFGVPFVGTDLRKSGADVMTYSMDKAAGAPTVGLIIGREEPLVAIRRALGMHGERHGAPLSFGKAAYVTNDPGKEALVGLIAALKALRDKPSLITEPTDKLYEIVVEEFKSLEGGFQDDLIITKSYNSGAVEINYENTWKDGKMGIPIFTIEDMYAGTNIFQAGMGQMGVIPTIAYDANIFISPGLGTTDEDGNLIKDRMRYAVRALVTLINITCKYAGLSA